MKLTGIKRFLPSKEIALERRKRTKPWLVGILVVMASPLLTLIYSYRQRTWAYVAGYAYMLLFSIICHLLELNLLLFNFFAYSPFGIMIGCGIFSFIFAKDLKEESLASTNFIENKRNEQ